MVRDGEAQAVIVLSAPSGNRGRDMAFAQAASEIVQHVHWAVGVEIDVLQTLPEGGYRPVRIQRAQPVEEENPAAPVPDLGGRIPLRIGDAAPSALDAWVLERTGASNGFALVVAQDGVDLRGPLPVSSQHAACALLGQLGVRWHQPMETGLVLPTGPDLALEAQRTAQKPAPEFDLMASVTPRATLYTWRMLQEWVAGLRQADYVTPTASADPDFIVGHSAGWPSSDVILPDQPLTMRLGGRSVEIQPFDPLPLYGFKIADPRSDGAKVNIVLTSGNHSEFTGSWALQGMVAFLLSDAAEAVELRRLATFYVYPMANPDGRYVLTRTGNPELAAIGWGNHLAVWLAPGRFATGDALTRAIRFDTRGRAEYLFDFHTNGSCTYTPPGLQESALIRALAIRVPSMTPSGWQRQSTVEWSMQPDGLNAPYAYQPEINPWLSVEESKELGRNYALSLHDALTGKVAGTRVDRLRSIALRPLPNTRGSTTLYQAARAGHLEKAREALAAGDSVQQANRLGMTPLHAAAGSGNLELVALLLERGASVNSANRRGWTPLHYATRHGHADIAALLLKQGAEVKARTRDGDSPLHLAAAFNRLEVAKHLLAAGADCEQPGHRGLRPLDWAERLGYREFLARLDPKE